VSALLVAQELPPVVRNPPREAVRAWQVLAACFRNLLLKETAEGDEFVANGVNHLKVVGPGPPSGGKLLSGAGDRVVFLVKEGLDLKQHEDVVAAVQPLVGRGAEGANHGELALPVTKNVAGNANNSAHLGDPEEPFIRDDRGHCPPGSERSEELPGWRPAPRIRVIHPATDLRDATTAAKGSPF